MSQTNNDYVLVLFHENMGQNNLICKCPSSCFPVTVFSTWGSPELVELRASNYVAATGLDLYGLKRKDKTYHNRPNPVVYRQIYPRRLKIYS